jgi:hypothetical protein
MNTELEREHRESLPRYTPKELLQIFPEAEQMIADKLIEVYGEIVCLRNKIMTLKSQAKDVSSDEFEQWFYKALVDFHWQDELEAKLKEHNNLKAYQYTIAGKEGIDDYAIMRAREYSIIELASRDLTVKRSGARYVCSCPFHNEKTASMCLYPHNNTYFCFGACGAFGDSIDWVMKFRNLTFKEAVMWLQ